MSICTVSQKRKSWRLERKCRFVERDTDAFGESPLRHAVRVHTQLESTMESESQAYEDEYDTADVVSAAMHCANGIALQNTHSCWCNRNHC